jgi:hypothetical protein
MWPDAHTHGNRRDSANRFTEISWIHLQDPRRRWTHRALFFGHDPSSANIT